MCCPQELGVFRTASFSCNSLWRVAMQQIPVLEVIQSFIEKTGRLGYRFYHNPSCDTPKKLPVDLDSGARSLHQEHSNNIAPVPQQFSLQQNILHANVINPNLKWLTSKVQSTLAICDIASHFSFSIFSPFLPTLFFLDLTFILAYCCILVNSLSYTLLSHTPPDHTLQLPSVLPLLSRLLPLCLYSVVFCGFCFTPIVS